MRSIIAYVCLATLWLGCSALGQTTRPVQDNLAQNGTFDGGTDGWLLVENVDGQQTQHPEWLAQLEVDPADGGGYALKVSLKDLDGKKAFSHTTGAVCRFAKAAPKNSRLIVTFQAKSLSGSPYLLIMRPAGGATVDRVATLTDQWQDFQVQVTAGPYPMSSLFFTLVREESPAPIQPVNDGQFLLRNVRIVLDTGATREGN